MPTDGDVETDQESSGSVIDKSEIEKRHLAAIVEVAAETRLLQAVKVSRGKGLKMSLINFDKYNTFTLAF